MTSPRKRTPAKGKTAVKKQAAAPLPYTIEQAREQLDEGYDIGRVAQRTGFTEGRIRSCPSAR